VHLVSSSTAAEAAALYDGCQLPWQPVRFRWRNNCGDSKHGLQVSSNDPNGPGLVVIRVPPGHGKSQNLGRTFSRPGKSWKIAKVMKSHGK